MLTGTTPITFLVTTNREAALKFYQGTLGLDLREDEGMTLVFNAGGVMLRISVLEAFTPQPFTVFGWQVNNLLSDVASLREKGVVFERYPFLTMDENEIATFADATRVAWFKDPDGNLLSLTQFPE